MNSTPKPNPHVVFLAQCSLLVWAGTILHKLTVEPWTNWSWLALVGAVALIGSVVQYHFYPPHRCRTAGLLG
jgi:hypothetical protein